MCTLSDCVVRIETGLWLLICITLSDSLRPKNVVKYLINVYHATTVHGPGLPWALGAGSEVEQFTVYSLRRSLITQLSNCQTNSRRYDDLLSTDCVDLSNTYRVIVLVMGLGLGLSLWGCTVGHP